MPTNTKVKDGNKQGCARGGALQCLAGCLDRATGPDGAAGIAGPMSRTPQIFNQIILPSSLLRCLASRNWPSAHLGQITKFAGEAADSQEACRECDFADCSLTVR